MTETQIAARIYLAAALAPGARVDLEPGQGHDLRDVLRLAPGAALAAFNAHDGEWLARIDALGRDRGRLAVESLRRAPKPARRGRSARSWPASRRSRGVHRALGSLDPTGGRLCRK